MSRITIAQIAAPPHHRRTSLPFEKGGLRGFALRPRAVRTA
ncbi:hypothetical protein [Lysobacter gummosus]